MARGTGRYNRTYTPELWEQVNPENKAIMDDFLLEYTQRKKSKRTVDGYFQDLRIILIHILQKYKNRSILELTKKDFRNICLWLSEGMGGGKEDSQGRSNSRVNRLKSALNSMLTYVEEEEDYDYSINQAKKIKGLPKNPVKTDEDDFFFTYAEFVQVKEKLLEMGDLQTAVLWSVFYDSGARKNEVFQVEKHGLLEGNKTNIVTGKRGKKFPLVYLNDTRELIRQYLEERGEDEIDSLWVAKLGKEKSPIKLEAIYQRILKCSDILSEIRGEETNLFPHSIRHSRAECLLRGEDDRLKDENGDNRKYTLDEIRVFLHHADPGTTLAYMKDHTEDTIDSMFGI